MRIGFNGEGDCTRKRQLNGQKARKSRTKSDRVDRDRKEVWQEFKTRSQTDIKGIMAK